MYINSKAWTCILLLLHQINRTRKCRILPIRKQQTEIPVALASMYLNVGYVMAHLSVINGFFRTATGCMSSVCTE